MLAALVLLGFAALARDDRDAHEGLRGVLGEDGRVVADALARVVAIFDARPVVAGRRAGSE